MTEISQRWSRVSSGFDDVADAASADDWGRSTPCDGWVARDVIGHLVSWVPPLLADGAGVDVGVHVDAAADPATAWRQLRDSITTLVNDEHAAAGTFEHPLAGRHRVDEAVDRFVTNDVLIHTWDLARSIGIDVALDPDTVERLLPGMEEMGDQLVASGHYQPAVVLDADADAQAQLIAATGRDPRVPASSPVASAIPKVVDHDTWERQLLELRAREKQTTRELDAIASARRRLPMVRLDDYALDGPNGPIALADIFEGRTQLIVYHHMWFPGEEWQCPGCTGFTSQFTRLEFLDNYDARFVIVTQGPIDDALDYQRRVGNQMEWYSTANSSFGADMGAPAGGGFQINVFLRDGRTVYRTYNSQGRGTEQVGHMFGLIDLLPHGRQEEWQDSPAGWPQSPTYSRWSPVESFAQYGSSEPA